MELTGSVVPLATRTKLGASVAQAHLCGPWGSRGVNSEDPTRTKGCQWNEWPHLEREESPLAGWTRIPKRALALHWQAPEPTRSPDPSLKPKPLSRDWPQGRRRRHGDTPPARTPGSGPTRIIVSPSRSVDLKVWLFALAASQDSKSRAASRRTRNAERRVAASGTLGRLGSARIIHLCGPPVWLSAGADGVSVDLRFCTSRGLIEPCVAGSSSHGRWSSGEDGDGRKGGGATRNRAAPSPQEDWPGPGPVSRLPCSQTPHTSVRWFS